MASFLLFAGILGLAVGVGALVAHRTAQRDAGLRMDEIERATGVTVPYEVRARLQPVVLRRLRWPMVGRASGYLVVAVSLALSGAFDGPLGQRSSLLLGLMATAAFAFAVAAGDLVAHLAAGSRGFPPHPRAPRSAQPDARRLDDYVAPVRLRAWGCSAAALVLSLPLALVVSRDIDGTASVLGLGVGAAALTVCSVAVLRLLLRRPVPGRGAERVWQEALLAQSFEGVASTASMTGATAVLLTLASVGTLRADLPTWTVGWATVLLVVALAAIGLLAHGLARHSRPAALRPRDLAA
jgi:hypothetical protein